MISSSISFIARTSDTINHHLIIETDPLGVAIRVRSFDGTSDISKVYVDTQDLRGIAQWMTMIAFDREAKTNVSRSCH